MSVAQDAIDDRTAMTPEPPAAEAEAKVETIEIFGQKIPTAEVAEYFDPSCDLRCDNGSLTRGVPAPKEFKQLRGKVIQVTALCPCAVRLYKRAHPQPAAPVAGDRALAAAAETEEPALPNPRAQQVRRKRERQDELRAELTRLKDTAAARTADLHAQLAAANTGARAADEIAAAARGEIIRLERVLADLRIKKTAAEATRDGAVRQAVDLETEIAAASSEIESKRILRLEHDIEKIDRQIRTIVAYHPEASDGR